MARLIHAEVAPVKGGDSRDVQAFGDNHDATIYDVEFRVGVGDKDTARST